MSEIQKISKETANQESSVFDKKDRKQTQKTKTEKLQKNTARLASATAFSLAILKLITAVFTGSMAILSSALDSLMDVMASIINYYSIQESQRPADRKHPYGHGKLESLAGLFQAQLMILSAVYVIYVSYQKSLSASDSPIQYLETGVAVMLVSILTSIFIYRRLKSVGEKTGSVALRADSLHYGSDALSNLGVLVTLIVVKFTSWIYIDLIVSVLISLYIIYAASGLLKEAIDILMDKTLDSSVIEKIHKIILSVPEVKNYHNLRTRKAGNRLFVEFHAVAPSTITFQKSHDIAEKLIYAIFDAFDSEIEVSVHMDPRDDEEKNKEIMDVGLNTEQWLQEKKATQS